MQLFEVLRRPLVTEKTTRLQEDGRYAFQVARDANKVQIKQAVEKAFKVKVVGVNVITMPGKRRKVGRRELVSEPWKKAIVKLRAGDKIQFFEGV